MPNWTATILTITGEGVEKFIDAVRGETNLDFNTLCPMPEDIGDDWYDWSCRNWGSKWNAAHVGNWELVNNQAKIRYDTAWSVSTPFFLTVSKLFPDLEFYQIFADEGGWFVGDHTICNGEISENNYKWTSGKGIAIRKLLDYFEEDESSEDDGDIKR